MKMKFLCLLALAAALSAAETPVDRIAAVVNDEVITSGELDGIFTQAVKAKPAISGEQADKIRKEILNDLIASRLIVQEAKKRNYEVSKGELDGALDQIKTQNGGSDNLSRLLVQENMTGEELTVRIKDNLLSEKLINDNVRREVKLDPKAYQELYEKNISQFTENKVTFKRAKVPFGADEAKARADAAALASKCRAGTEMEGDSSTMLKEDLNPDMAAAVFAMKEGEVSDPVKLADGFYVFKVTKIDAGKVLALDAKVDFQGQKVELREKLKALLFQDRFIKKRNEFVAKLKEGAVIDLR